jgi:LDH2 family malate/lactate/ureidoglycolate dehydrogenase
MLGTNPISFAAPTLNEPPFVADFATTTASNGKLEILQRKNKQTPTGWVQDTEGALTTDAHILKKGGALLPLGSDLEGGSHKGFMLGSIVDILSGVLSGANFGPWVPPLPAYLPLPEGMPGKGVGHFFGAMRIDAFGKADDFKKQMDLWIQRFRNAIPIDSDQKVVIPGDPERKAEEFIRKNGITLHPEVIDELKALANKFSIIF